MDVLREGDVVWLVATAMLVISLSFIVGLVALRQRFENQAPEETDLDEVYDDE